MIGLIKAKKISINIVEYVKKKKISILHRPN